MSDRLAADRLDVEPAGGHQDSAWLRAIADRDFSPSPPALERSETRARIAFRTAFGAADSGGTIDAPTRRVGQPARAGARVGRIGRIGRTMKLSLAAALAIVVAAAGGTAAAGPGAPLYAVRLVVERTMLPAPGQPARLEAELALVDRRLADAAATLQRGDTRAAAAALEAVGGDVAGIGPEAELHGLRRRAAVARLDEDAVLVRRLGAALSGDAVPQALDALRTARAKLVPADRVRRDHALRPRPAFPFP